MNEVSEAVAHWLEQKRRRDRIATAVIAGLALGGGTVVFLLTSFVIYGVLSLVSGALLRWDLLLGLIALVLSAGIFVRCGNSRPDERQLGLDPMGVWILRDLYSFGPRLMREGMRQVRCYALLGELNLVACARALAYLAVHESAVSAQELLRQCGPITWARLREQLGLVDGVLFLGDDADRVCLMEPVRVRLRHMLQQEPAGGRRPEASRRPEPAPQTTPLNEPEKLGAYEILGLSASATAEEIKAAYRKRVKACHPDLFAGMDAPAQALAERWTKALNAAYLTLNPRQRGSAPTNRR